MRKICQWLGYHLIITSTDGGRCVRGKCVICGWYIQTFMGFEPKLKFKRIAFEKNYD